MKDAKVKVAVLGCGDRGINAYSVVRDVLPDNMEIVAAADLKPERLEIMREKFGVPENMCFSSAEEFLEKDKMCDAVFICTMDRDHYREVIPAMKKGYDVLLEKPVSPELYECVEIGKVARETGRKVVVCHVLRYTEYYRKIKELINEGAVGDIVSVQSIEPVMYWHQAHSFVRGNWHSSEETSPMILQKCCHDLDTFVWLCDKKIEKVSSFGSLKFFKKENAPEGSAERCTDCKYKDTCPYSALSLYMNNLKNGNTDWPVCVVKENATEETLLEALKTGPYGKCVFRCDNDVVDHQVVNILMEDGVTVNFTMCAFTKPGARLIRIMGTYGEIEGDFGNNIIHVRPFGKDDYDIDVSSLIVDAGNYGHGGGDMGLVRDFLHYVATGEKAEGITDVAVSLESHFACIAAEKSRLSGGQVISVEELIKEVNSDVL